VSLADVEKAAERLRGRIIKTPLLTSTAIDEHISKLVSPPEGPAIDVRICFKAEHLQLTG
jgi:threonine dehydratase